MLTAGHVAALTSTGSRARAWRRALTGYLFLAPAVALIGLFMLVPFIQGIALSFQSWDGVARDVPWIGWRNYEMVFADEIFWASMRNAVAFGLIGFVLGNALSLGMAIAVDGNPRGTQFYRIAFSDLLYISSGEIELRPKPAIIHNIKQTLPCGNIHSFTDRKL